MRRKAQYFKKTRNGVWSRRGEWMPTYVFNQQNQAGAEYQHYMYGPDNQPLCAGVTRHERMNRAVANQIVRVWRRWRDEYVAQNPGNYPTAQEAHIPVARIAVFPVGDHNAIQWYSLG